MLLTKVDRAWRGGWRDTGLGERDMALRARKIELLRERERGMKE